MSTPRQLREDGGGHVTWRVRVDARLADKPFGVVQLDISPRAHELGATDRIILPNSLDFADIPATQVEIVDVDRHAAEKFHGMTRDFGDRENFRVRDLLDLVILLECELLTPAAVARDVRIVWRERDHAEPPRELPPFPPSWPDRYENLVRDHKDLETRSFPTAIARVQRLWAEMFPDRET